MSSKSKPGPFDAYGHAKHDEEMHVLLARWPESPILVDLHTFVRAGSVLGVYSCLMNLAILTSDNANRPLNHPDFQHLLETASRMRAWKRENP